jgi:hypothetical protein
MSRRFHLHCILFSLLCLILAASRACAFAMLQRTCSAVDSLWEYNVHCFISHLRWTCKGTVHLCFASAVDSFCFEYSALAPQKKLLLVHFTPCNFSFLSRFSAVSVMSSSVVS